MIILYILSCLIIISFSEWFIHRHIMHRKLPKFIYKLFPRLYGVYFRHVPLHHRTYFKKFDHEPDEIGRKVNIKFSFIAGIILGITISIPLAFISITFSIFLLIFIIIHHLLWNLIHNEMHNPKPSWYRKLPIFKYLARFHYLHHKYPGKNYGIVVPFADFIMGTSISLGKKDIKEAKEMDLV